jgi:hypothetical protein
MRRLPLIVVGGYLLLAVSTRVAEARGLMRCGCSDDCWCKRPGLSAFRWVLPFGHHGGLTPEEKRRLVEH